MAPHGARASTSTVRIRFTCIEETFQCLPEHMSVLKPLTELNQVRRSTLSPWKTWHQGIHGHSKDQLHIYRRDISVFTRAHEHTEAIDRTMSTWAYWGHWQNYEHTEAIGRTMSTWAYWGHWQKYEHMSILRPLTELWAHVHTEVIDRTMSTWTYWGHWQKNEHMSMLRPLTELNPVRRSTLSLWMTRHLMGPGHPQSQWGSNSHV